MAWKWSQTFGRTVYVHWGAVTLPRRGTGWNLQGYPKLTKRYQPLVGRSSPYCGDVWAIYCCLTGFFSIVDTCLSCEDRARQGCAMVPRWRFFASCISSDCMLQYISDLHSKFALRPHCVEVWQTSSLRRLRLGEEKKERRKKETTGQKYNGLPYSIGRP